MAGEGEAGTMGGPKGDLYIYIHVKPDRLFRREGNDVVMEIPISFAQAALGDEIEIDTLDGKAKLKIPEGTQSGTVFRLRGKGITDLHGYGRGDQLVHVKVMTPKKLTEKQKALLKEFANLSKENINGDDKGFFDRVKGAFMG